MHFTSLTYNYYLQAQEKDRQLIINMGEALEDEKEKSRNMVKHLRLQHGEAIGNIVASNYLNTRSFALDSLSDQIARTKLAEQQAKYVQ